ncbi:TRAP transporter large permease [Aquisalimonas lutea]|uniref:TRAP transporter large permease n=1 Tax=Aquisalimonas lutea TaxID=1327750 RepID=UPI0025B47B9A|nr:TRAP transporter large permease [Aquisalimonas lutea]MDN3518641.1 TRAP transporter large permease [Aquisalimonas lutea]
MTPLDIGGLVIVTLLVLLALGTPVAFALGGTALIFLYFFEGPRSMGTAAETLYASLNSFELLAIPMFILMGAAVAHSRAGPDLYEALERWLYRVPGGLLVSNIGACGIFAALSGSSPATCAAIGKMGIPEMRKRGYPEGLAAGAIGAGGTLGILIPPSVTMIVYGIATETSIGRLFAAGILPGLMIVVLFCAWGIFYSHRYGQAYRLTGAGYSWRERFVILPKVLPFLAVVVGVLWTLYGGVATPSEAAGVGALFCILLVVIIYRVRNPRSLWTVLNTSMRESVMIMMILGAAGLFSFMLSSLYVTQTLAEMIVALEINRWLLLALINVFLLIAGLFLPPVAVIVMVAPTLIPIITDIGFDPIWFAVVLTLNMEVGLITPPVGLNLYVLNAIAPDVRLGTILWGSLPFALILLLGIVILCVFPGIATWLPEVLMG